MYVYVIFIHFSPIDLGNEEGHVVTIAFSPVMMWDFFLHSVWAFFENLYLFLV